MNENLNKNMYSILYRTCTACIHILYITVFMYVSIYMLLNITNSDSIFTNLDSLSLILTS